MSDGRRGPAPWIRRRGRAMVAVASALVVVGSGTSCGRSSRDGSADPLRFEPSTPPSWKSSPGAATEPERVLELHLDEVRLALREGRTRRAGQLLAAVLRELEADSRSHVALDPRAAATFEVVRRTADRWQAGVHSGVDEQRTVLRSLQDEARRLLGPT